MKKLILLLTVFSVFFAKEDLDNRGIIDDIFGFVNNDSEGINNIIENFEKAEEEVSSSAVNILEEGHDIYEEIQDFIAGEGFDTIEVVSSAGNIISEIGDIFEEITNFSIFQSSSDKITPEEFYSKLPENEKEIINLARKKLKEIINNNFKESEEFLTVMELLNKNDLDFLFFMKLVFFLKENEA